MAFRDKPLRCPRCGKDLVRYEDRDKWRCKECLGALVGIEQLEVEIGPVAAHVIADVADASRPAIHPCPVCAFPLTPYTVNGIELDRCQNDFVVWFDGGEIGKLRKTIPADDPSPLFTNAVGFLTELREQSAAMKAGQLDELPLAEPLEIKPEEWEKRRLCRDGACTGVLGDDGRCKTCRSARA
jgi:Zn-finger nucleic acid-binding protein